MGRAVKLRDSPIAGLLPSTGKCAAVPARFCNDAPGMGHFNPLFRNQDKTVKSGLFSKPVELDGIKIRIIKLLPDTEELDSVLAQVHPRVRVEPGKLGEAEVRVSRYGRASLCLIFIWAVVGYGGGEWEGNECEICVDV